MEFMSIRTIEDSFDYQMERVLKKLHEQYKAELSELPFNEWMWVNAADLGKAVYNAYDEYAGIDTLIEKIEQVEP